MAKVIFIFGTIFFLISFAKENSKENVKKNLKAGQMQAHVHGGATLNIAFDQLNGKIEFKAASMGILGFEHVAKSVADQKMVSEVTSRIEKKIDSMVIFEPSLGCVLIKEKIENEKHGQHSDFMAYFKVLCKKTILGSKITFDFTEFKNIKDIDVVILADNLQKTTEVKEKPVTIDLK